MSYSSVVVSGGKEHEGKPSTLSQVSLAPITVTLDGIDKSKGPVLKKTNSMQYLIPSPIRAGFAGLRSVSASRIAPVKA